jgi:hypothetical protein
MRGMLTSSTRLGATLVFKPSAALRTASDFPKRRVSLALCHRTCQNLAQLPVGLARGKRVPAFHGFHIVQGLQRIGHFVWRLPVIVPHRFRGSEHRASIPHPRPKGAGDSKASIAQACFQAALRIPAPRGAGMRQLRTQVVSARRDRTASVPKEKGRRISDPSLSVPLPLLSGGAMGAGHTLAPGRP